ncbi:NAD(P)H-binding protein [Streptomyces spectabilis]|uniref:NAD-dependent epimerase/dehydratase family protein n=1 Tax=Streptomyces spectabilis TaxID=68270 RepID=A0A5P2XCH1_STRST|nr:NAD(P)H-binding protein [Streptomyces spectabilis]MBB5104520.1 putative NADH-flavin reductase [Streptomyces spectabilis]MCI3905125.1 NAD(P)H-binding protein [Streptomyces spectabilis]QEV62141.1 NAD-dependent epimerase/dehydratase family protein [Streptomyces spectabilis]GGV00483.1 NmrA family transcriptional regulator [Streptomyces spectabilis]
MQLAIFGANSSTGRHLTAQALAAGHTVTAAVRRPDGFPLSDPKLQTLGVDVYDKSAVERAIAGQDAVISILGIPYGRKPVTVLSRGITHITDAMALHGVKRLVTVTSRLLAVHAPKSSGEKPLYERFMYRRVLYPILTTMGRTLYDDMVRMEHITRATDLDWTIVRPSALYNTDEVSAYHVGPPESPGLYTSRIDLAHSLLREVTDNAHVHSTVSVFTTEGVPTFRDVLKKEVMRIGSWDHK